jgi:uncharacterized protein
MPIDREEIVKLTEQYGGEWGINHTRRILHLASLLAQGVPYDEEAFWIAAHLHDWGGYAEWAKPGVDHAARSVEVAGEFLRARGHPESSTDRVLECIGTHHSGDADRGFEAILLSDADGLDFLGAVGVLRDFSKAARDLRAGYNTARKRAADVPKRLCLEKSRELAAARLAEMEALLTSFEQGSFGCF